MIDPEQIIGATDRQQRENFSVNILDPTDLGYQLISNINIFFGEFGLAACMLYAFDKVYSKASYRAYRLEASTMYSEHHEFLSFSHDIQQAFRKTDHDPAISFEDFGKEMRLHFKQGKFKKSPPVCKVWKWEESYTNIDGQPMGQESKEIEDEAKKPYTFNAIGLLGIDYNDKLIVLAFDRDEQQSLEELENMMVTFEKELSQAIRFSDSPHDQIGQYQTENADEMYSHIIQSYKRMLWENDDIAGFHLFLFNAYDRRLYYSYTDNMVLNLDALEEYPGAEIAKGIDLALSEEQYQYIFQKVEQTLSKKGLSVDLQEKLLNDAEHLTRLFAKPEELRAYFADLNSLDASDNATETKDKVDLLKLIFSCIPQEP